MAETILVVEDDLVLRETLVYNLKKQDYTVFSAADGLQALTIARAELPDLVLLDIMLPGLDGLEVCRILRQETTASIIMLTARADEVDKVVGLEVGADDYLTKPFSMHELLARIKAQLRRVRLIRDAAAALSAGSFHILDFGDLVINTDRREVLLAGKPVVMKPQEYELLLYLVTNRGRVLTREQLLQQVWGWDFSGGSRTVDVHVRWLREKLEQDPANPTRIVTVRGAGYVFEG